MIYFGNKVAEMSDPNQSQGLDIKLKEGTPKSKVS